jgi:PAS domain S-box-containing protein
VLTRLVAVLDEVTEVADACGAGVDAARVLLRTDEAGVVGVPGVASVEGGELPIHRGPPRAFARGDAWLVVAPMGDDRAIVARTPTRPSPAALRALAAVAALIRRVCADEAAELRQRENEARLQAIISNTPNVAIQGYDRDGRVLWWNRAAETVFGWPAHVAVGRTLDQLMLDLPGAAAFVETLREVEHSGRPSGPTEWSCRRPDGHEVVVISTIFAIPGPRGTKHFVCMDVDVTEARHTQEALRRSEEQLRQSQKMEAVGRLAGGVAHDFNNMLVAILGYADLLARTLPQGGAQRRQAEEIVSAARRASSLTTQLLAFSRQQVPAPRGVDLGAVVGGIESMLRRLIGEDVDLSIRVPSEPVWVLADAGQIEQVLLNLVINARDAMPKGGRLVVDVIPTRSKDGCAQLVVTDSGTGMSDEIRARIFEPFFTTKEATKGTGLGLSVVYGIVHQWRGEIDVTSAPGAGSTFRVRVPGTEAPEPAAGARAEARGACAGGTLLVVEDERAVRDYLAEVLAGIGYRVVVAADPAEAMARAGELERVDLLITDVIMPGKSGPALVHARRERWPTLPVLYISGYAPGNHEAHRPDPRGSFLQKPFTVDELRARVAALLGEPVSA